MGRIGRYRGSLLGLAAGDALGTTLEFRPPGHVRADTDMVGGGPFGLKPGEWTDDTSMALCLAESLVERSGFDPADQLDTLRPLVARRAPEQHGPVLRHRQHDAAAAPALRADGEPYCGLDRPATRPATGRIMRLAPVPLFFAGDPREAIAPAADSSRTTHGAPEASTPADTSPR